MDRAATDHRRVLVAYHSADGQTAKIAERIADRLRRGGIAVESLEVAHAPEPHGFDAVVVGDSIHAGHHSRALTRWLAHHGEAIGRTPFALFQVSLASATDDAAHAAEAHHYLQQLLVATRVHPDIVGLFGGALAYTRYGWLKRRLMRSIAQRSGGPTDTGADHEFTDWEAVDHFADDVVRLIELWQAADRSG
jgi:menaquinone-dependent protoporphyrinogen oxidase